MVLPEIVLGVDSDGADTKDGLLGGVSVDDAVSVVSVMKTG